MNKLKVLTVSIILMLVLSLAGPSIGVAARPLAALTPVGLGTAESFAVLAKTAVNDSVISQIRGDVGLSPASWLSALTCLEVTGTIYSVDASGPLLCRVTNPGLLTTAINAMTAAYTDAANRTPFTTLAGGDNQLGGQTLLPGVYRFGHATTANLTAAQPLTLNAQGDPNAVFIFQASSDLVTASSSAVQLINNAQACNVYWQIGSQATLGTSTTFLGTVLAGTAIVDNGGSTVQGRFLAQSAVTLNNTHITRPLCAPAIATTLHPSTSVTVGTAVHDSATLTGATSTAGGTVTYAAYTNNTCTGISQDAGTKPVTNGKVPDSNPITFTSVGTFYWQVVYHGDSNNDVATSPCTSEVLTVNAAPTLTRTPAPNAGSTSTPGPGSLPASGFAPQRVSLLSAQPAQKAYAELGDLWLEIPRLDVQMPIVGVPQTDGEWDVSWLGNDAGWLNGTAFPTWAGNSVLTGHVYNADGNPGPFVHLNWMWWGDQVVVHAWGAQYVYAVRQVYQVTPGSISSVIKHEELPWVTLVTCRGYDEASNSYTYRVVVRAVLVEVK